VTPLPRYSGDRSTKNGQSGDSPPTMGAGRGGVQAAPAVAEFGEKNFSLLDFLQKIYEMCQETSSIDLHTCLKSGPQNTKKHPNKRNRAPSDTSRRYETPVPLGTHHFAWFVVCDSMLCWCAPSPLSPGAQTRAHCAHGRAA